MTDREPQELTDPEFWVLVSLDAEAAFFELLWPITVHIDGEDHPSRPSLTIPEAQEALTSLVSRGLVEVLVETEDEPNEWPVVSRDQVVEIVEDPANWEGTYAQTKYWAATTEEGEAAYRRKSEALYGPWRENPEPKEGPVKRFLRYLYRDMMPRWLHEGIQADVARHKATRERKRSERTRK